jgi:hypothetical protein
VRFGDFGVRNWDICGPGAVASDGGGA